MDAAESSPSPVPPDEGTSAHGAPSDRAARRWLADWQRLERATRGIRLRAVGGMDEALLEDPQQDARPAA